MSSVNRKTISLSVLSTTAAINAGHVITAGDSSAYTLEVTFTDVTTISGACNLHCVRGDGQTSDITATIDSNKVSYTLDSGLYTVAGLIIYMQFLNSNIYTPLKITFSGIRLLPGGPAIEDLTPYPDWLAAIADANDAADAANAAAGSANDASAATEAAEALRVIAEDNRVDAEDDRVLAEAARVSAEAARVIAEGLRVTAEGNRVTHESGRVSAENGRVSAESARAVYEAYNAGTTYVATNKVTSGGSSYMSLTTQTGVAPPGATWLLIASKGADGPSAASGISIADAGNHFAGSNAETVTQEIAVTLEGHTSQITNLENLNKAYGVYWDGGTGSALTRRGAAVGKVFAPTIGTTGAVNDFESIKPWSDCKLCNLADNGAVNAYYGEPGFALNGSNGQVMLEIPKFYYKVVMTGDARESWVSPDPLTGFAVHPAFVVNGAEKSKIYVAAYMGSEVSSKLVSKTGVVPAKNYTRSQFRTKARARGTGWGICDLVSYNALQVLMKVMTAHFEAQVAVGKGISEMPYTSTHTATVAETAANRIIVSNANAALYTVGWLISIGTYQGGQNVAIDRTITSIDVYDASNKAVVFDGAAVNIAIGNMLYAVPQKTGGADALGNKTGRAAGTDGQTEVSFMGLQGMWGNWWQFIDGANMDSSYYMWYNDNPATHADDTFVSPYKRINHVLASTEGYIRRLGYDAVEPWSMLPSEVGGSSSGPVGDYFYRSGTPGNRILTVGGFWFFGVSAGPWYWYVGYASSDADWCIGARLLYKPA